MRLREAVLILICLLLVSQGNAKRREKLTKQTQSEEQRKTIVEANHFYSNYQTTTNYDINSVEKDKSLIFYLKPHNKEATDATLQKNPITITLNQGGNHETCIFHSYRNLCSIAKVSTNDLKMKIQCNKTPCELSWLIIQPVSKQEDGEHAAEQLIAINKDKNHAILKVVCNNPDLKERFADGLTLFTNSKYRKISTKVGIVYYLFSNEEKGSYFLSSDDDKLKYCAKASLVHSQDQISFKNLQNSKIGDFIYPEEPSAYQIKDAPNSDFRIQCSAHDPTFLKLKNTTGVKVELFGYKSQIKNKLSSVTLMVDNQKQFIDFSIVFKSQTQKFDRIVLEMSSVQKLLMIQINFVAGNVQQIEFGQQSYFQLKKGDTINYKVIPISKDVKDIQQMHIFVSDSKLFKVNRSSCNKKGCQFSLQAIEEGTGNVYLGESENKNTSQTIIEQFDKSVTKKIREGDQVYYSFKIKAKQAYQLLVNSPNVIIYASSVQKCKLVDEQKCYQKSFNSHNPAVYESNINGILQFKVIGLDNCEFTLTVLDSGSQYINLVDTQPFAYLMDDQQMQIYFIFMLKQKQDVTFNLIAPVNQLNLVVANVEKTSIQSIKESDQMMSLDGFIHFSKQDLTKLGFVVKIQKLQKYKHKYVHFTLIASTKQVNLRLQSGVAHYQTLNILDQRDYVFEFIPQKNIFINFYVHNLNEGININLKISNVDEYTNQNNTAEFTINQPTDTLNLALISEQLCRVQKGQNCELFVRLQNKMNVQIDLTLTLLTTDSIVELKDGIWQNYGINLASTSSHFYFQPTHQNHSVTIFYHCSVIDIKLLYNLWKTDDKAINPQEWPFPIDKNKDKQLQKIKQFRPSQFVHIDWTKLKLCWPNCVILLSIDPDVKALRQSFKNAKQFASQSQHFKIMASNNYIQLPQKHKIDVVLTVDEQKYILIDLKYIMQKNQLIFYTYFMIGSTQMKANVYSQKNPRCPTMEDESDYIFSGIQTAIQIESLSKKIKQNDLTDNGNVYLCLLSHAYTDSKFSIQFTSQSEEIKNLMRDSSFTLKSQANKQTMFQVNASQQFYLKINRNDGFPYISKQLCKSDQDMEQCLQNFKSNDEKGEQLFNKMFTISEEPCAKCMLYIKIKSNQPFQIILHSQSKYTETDLIQNTPLNDALAPNQQNLYSLLGSKKQQIIINIQIISGNIKIQIHDFMELQIIKKNEKGSSNIHIVIPMMPNTTSKSDLFGLPLMDEYVLSPFHHLHLIIDSQNPKQPAFYTITYSSGDTQVYLQDGLISQYNLISKKTTTFLYHNPTSTNIYLHATTDEVEHLHNLVFKIYGLNNQLDQDSKIQLTPEKTDFKKKTPSPTLMMELPNYQQYLMTVTNNNLKDVLFTIGVNNKQIIYLPFDHQFPVQLKESDYIYILLSTSTQGYVSLNIKKCDQSQPFIAYTLDSNQFRNQIFAAEKQMTQQLVTNIIIKVKAGDAIYIRIRTTQTDKSLLTVKSIFHSNKIQNSKVKSGDNGNILYQLLDSTKVELSLTSVVCPSNQKNCYKDFTYSSISSTSMESLYSQMICSSIMFDLNDELFAKKAQIITINSSSIKGNKIVFTQQLKGDSHYFGVRATNSKNGEIVFYKPIQITTFWGQVHRQSSSRTVFILILISVFVCMILLIYRRCGKKEKDYRLIEQDLNQAFQE